MKLLIFLAASLTLSADTISFNWSAEKSTGDPSTATGNGIITYTNSLTNISLQDVTNFYFSYTDVMQPDIGNPQSFTYIATFGLSNLSVLSLTITNNTVSDGEVSLANDWGTYITPFLAGTPFALFGPVTWGNVNTPIPEPKWLIISSLFTALLWYQRAIRICLNRNLRSGSVY